MISRRILLLALAGLAFVSSATEPATAQSYPMRPVRFLVPFPAGGSTDVAARIVAENLSRAFGQQVYVENRSGAAGIIGIEAAAKSSPDGYTVLIAPDFTASAPHVYKMNIDPLKDLVPIVQLSRQPVVQAVHPSLGVSSLAELIAFAKQRPGLSYATGAGTGAQQHIVAEWFARLAGLKLEQVPYRGGAPAINDLIGGHVKIGWLGSTPLIPHHKAGTLRLLAQSTAERSPSLPDVPTYGEAGFGELVLDQWLGVFVPTGTPIAIAARLNAEINKALAEPAIRASFLQAAQEPVAGTAERFSELFRADYAKYARLVKELKIKAD
jgi:tripartite-type tricarboxylate transporter receptor subunit TctC